MGDLLKELCFIPGVSGCENLICKYVYDKLLNFANVSIKNDNTVVAVISPSESTEPQKHILFDAHIDQIGLIVTAINKDGFIKFDTCGGFDPKILYGSSVVVHGTDDFKGVICSIPPHLKKDKEKAPDIDDMFIDLGMPLEKVKEKISLGDRISFENKFYELLNGNIASPATDDRAGVYVLIKLAEKLSRETLNTKVTILLSSREEVGRMGVATATYKIMPDEAVSIDVSFAKQPGVSSDRHCVLGKGPMICIAPSLSSNISKFLIETATKASIPYQLEVYGEMSGTNADVINITRGGIPCGLVSIPQRYMHTGIEIVNYNDLENIVKLLFNYAKQGGAQQ